jgi:hypothetical protein
MRTIRVCKRDEVDACESIARLKRGSLTRHQGDSADWGLSAWINRRLSRVLDGKPRAPMMAGLAPLHLVENGI